MPDHDPNDPLAKAMAAEETKDAGSGGTEAAAANAAPPDPPAQQPPAQQPPAQQPPAQDPGVVPDPPAQGAQPPAQDPAQQQPPAQQPPAQQGPSEADIARQNWLAQQQQRDQAAFNQENQGLWNELQRRHQDAQNRAAWEAQERARAAQQGQAPPQPAPAQGEPQNDPYGFLDPNQPQGQPQPQPQPPAQGQPPQAPPAPYPPQGYPQQPQPYPAPYPQQQPQPLPTPEELAYAQQFRTRQTRQAAEVLGWQNDGPGGETRDLTSQFQRFVDDPAFIEVLESPEFSPEDKRFIVADLGGASEADLQNLQRHLPTPGHIVAFYRQSLAAHRAEREAAGAPDPALLKQLDQSQPVNGAGQDPAQSFGQPGTSGDRVGAPQENTEDAQGGLADTAAEEQALRDMIKGGQSRPLEAGI